MTALECVSAAWLDRCSADPELWDDFHALCGFGGRLAGTPGEAAAQRWVLARLQAIAPHAQQQKVPYDGWRCDKAALVLADAHGTALHALPCQPLLRSANTPPEGLWGQVVDLGQGREADFARVGSAVAGHIALVQHEYPFSPQHLHRRRKYDMALRAGAVGFLMANPLPGAGLLSGSSGRAVGAAGIPAAYIDHVSGQKLAAAAAQGKAWVRLHIQGTELSNAQAGITVLDVPGGTGQRIVLSAHLDGHDLGCSALDNATGLSVVLAAARALMPLVSSATHGLRVCVFSAEEWALAGSAQYLQALPAAERDSLALNLNLDTVGGDMHLTALVSGFVGLQDWVAQCGQAAGIPTATHLPLMPNSDHANFAAHGIPALRLVAGFDRPQSNVRHILSADDQPRVVQQAELRQALRLTCAMGWQALHMPTHALHALKLREAN